MLLPPWLAKSVVQSVVQPIPHTMADFVSSVTERLVASAIICSLDVGDVLHSIALAAALVCAAVQIPIIFESSANPSKARHQSLWPVLGGVFDNAIGALAIQSLGKEAGKHSYMMRIIGLGVSAVALLVALKPRTASRATLPLAAALILIAAVLSAAGLGGGKAWSPPVTAVHIKIFLQAASSISSITLALAPSLADKSTTTAPISTLALLFAALAALADCLAHKAFIPAGQATFVGVIAALQLAGFRLCPRAKAAQVGGVPSRAERLVLRQARAKAEANALALLAARKSVIPAVLVPSKPKPPTAQEQATGEDSGGEGAKAETSPAELKEE